MGVSLPCQVTVLVLSACGERGHNPSPLPHPSHQRTLSICEVTEFHGPRACGQGCWPISNPRTQELLRRTRCNWEPETLQLLTPEARTRGRRCSRRSHSAIQEVKEAPGLAWVLSTPPGHHGPWLATASGVGSLPRCDRHQGLCLL